MSEPIVLHDADGNTLTVYTRGQAETLLAGGQWYATAADAKVGKQREEPTAATAGKLAALEGDGNAVVTEAATDEQPAPAVEESAPAPSAPTKATKRPAAKKPKGGDL